MVDWYSSCMHSKHLVERFESSSDTHLLRALWSLWCFRCSPLRIRSFVATAEFEDKPKNSFLAFASWTWTEPEEVVDASMTDDSLTHLAIPYQTLPLGFSLGFASKWNGSRGCCFPTIFCCDLPPDTYLRALPHLATTKCPCLSIGGDDFTVICT